jgi:hypothetical protein
MRMGAGKNRIAGAPRPQHRRRMRREEQGFQASLVKTLAMVLDPLVLFFHVPNGGQRTPAEAAILIGQGVLPGMGDLVFFWPDAAGIGRAAVVECKRLKGGVASAAQERVELRLEAAGVPVRFVRTLREALEFLDTCGVPFRIKPASIKGLE